MMMKWMNRISFYRRIQLSFVLFILLPFAIVTFNTYSSIERSVTENIQGARADVLNAISGQLTKTVDSISFAAVYFAESKDPELQESLHTLSALTQFDSFEAYQQYDKLNNMSNILLVQSLEANLRMFMLNSDSRIIMGNLPNRVFSRLDDDSFLQAVHIDTGNTISLQWFRAEGDGKVPFYYYACRLIVDPTNHGPLATLFIGIPESYFTKLFETSQSGTVALYDTAGSLIASSGDKEANQVRPDMIRMEKIIPKLNWKLVYDTPRSEVTGQIRKELVLSVTEIGAFFALFLLFSVYLARSLNMPIERLRRTAKSYVAGNRDIRMPVSGRDEMAILSLAFNRLLDDIDKLIEKVESEQEEKRIIELQALFSQIRPHFLLNTLNSIKVKLLMANDKPHAHMIDSLISLLRAYVRVHELAALAEEDKLHESYVQIMQIRNKLDITYHSRIADEVADLRIPRLLLQPIIENAIIHGFTLHPADARIELVAEKAGDCVMISVSDNGRGMQEERLAELRDKLRNPDAGESPANKGVGLVNVARRLKLTYGVSAEIQAYLRPEGGMAFVLILPNASGPERGNGNVQSHSG